MRKFPTDQELYVNLDISQTHYNVVQCGGKREANYYYCRPGVCKKKKKQVVRDFAQCGGTDNG